jgi:D-glycero-alpha-D-manno-heptose 1-phosphate guanylyltransferase
MTKECIVLAGGLGTRLRSVLADKPKCMAPVNGRPFLFYMLHYLHQQGITHAILALGYKSEQVIDWCNNTSLPLRISFAIEPEPLGTGGAILNALPLVENNEIFIVNGDTFFDVPLPALYTFHIAKQAQLSLSLKPMQQFERYGSITINEDQQIIAFHEKKYCETGLINGGVYLTTVSYLRSLHLPEKCSFEKEVLEAQATSGHLYGFISNTYFIDIGIPADYEQAQQDLPIRTASTLFLDRDGVINQEITNSYVLDKSMFRFNPGVLPALAILAKLFSRIVIVTNQRCIGKGMLTEAGLQEIHQHMLDEIALHHGRIDKIYFCPEVESNHPCRKPNSGMALQAQQDFPDIDFTQSVMVGNTLSDMQFGKNLGMTTVFIPSTLPDTPFPHPLMDARYADLWQFAQAIQ